MKGIIENNLNALVAFVEVARQGGFNKAADALGLQPSTLSRRIAALESELGVRLFLRTTRSVHLTHEGATLFDEINDHVSEISNAAHRLKAGGEQLQGRVRVATSDTMAEICLLPVLPELARSYPGIQVELDLAPEIVDLHQRRIDFAIRAGDLGAPGQVARKIGVHRFCQYHAPGARDARAMTFDPKGFPVDAPLLAAENFHLLRRMVLAGQGAALMPDAFCLEQEEAGRLIRDPSVTPVPFDVFVAYPDRIALGRRARLVMDMVIDHAAQTGRRCSALEKATP